MHPKLNTPSAALKIRDEKVWDVLRNKYVLLTPEEWVRQHLIHLLINHLNFPSGRMISEHLVKYNGMAKRCDIAIFGSDTSVEMVVECKAPEISITEDTFLQTSKYIYGLKARAFLMSNGMNHYMAIITDSGKIQYLPEIPNYNELIKLIG